jgi:hypothetical protein
VGVELLQHLDGFLDLLVQRLGGLEQVQDFL